MVFEKSKLDQSVQMALWKGDLGHSLVSFVDNGLNAQQHTACAFLDIRSDVWCKKFDYVWPP